MSRPMIAAVFVFLILKGLAGVVWKTALANEPEKPTVKAKAPNAELRTFMRKKLEASNQILEGLAMEDTDLIKQGATVLAEMSHAEKWRISNDVMYKQFSDEFHRNATKLVEAANDKNIDRAALRWMDTTLSCIECHRFVRNELVVKADEPAKPLSQPVDTVRLIAGQL